MHRSILVLAEESLRCVEVAPRTATPEDGLTIALSVESGGRADVLDLDRAFFMGDGGTVDVSWLGLPPDSRHPYQLLLQVTVTNPIDCAFAVGIPVETTDPGETLRRLGYLLAADRLAIAFDAPATAQSVIILAAPADRRALLAALRELNDWIVADRSRVPQGQHGARAQPGC